MVRVPPTLHLWCHNISSWKLACLFFHLLRIQNPQHFTLPLSLSKIYTICRSNVLNNILNKICFFKEFRMLTTVMLFIVFLTCILSLGHLLEFRWHLCNSHNIVVLMYGQLLHFTTATVPAKTFYFCPSISLVFLFLLSLLPPLLEN